MLAFIVPILALILACLAMRYSKPDSSRLRERREPLMVGVQIICGDCSGDGATPVRTFLDSSGNKCGQCGGTSYTLASVLAVAALQARAARSSARSLVPGAARVLPFETGLAKADLRSARIA